VHHQGRTLVIGIEETAVDCGNEAGIVAPASKNTWRAGAVAHLKRDGLLLEPHNMHGREPLRAGPLDAQAPQFDAWLKLLPAGIARVGRW
jgi:hypothetical protein